VKEPREVWAALGATDNEHDTSPYPDLLADDVVVHLPGDNRTEGIAAYRGFIEALFAGLPDYHAEPEEGGRCSCTSPSREHTLGNCSGFPPVGGRSGTRVAPYGTFARTRSRKDGYTRTALQCSNSSAWTRRRLDDLECDYGGRGSPEGQAASIPR
jgi:hypothetical protein